MQNPFTQFAPLSRALLGSRNRKSLGAQFLFTDDRKSSHYFKNLGGGVESRHASYSENKGQHTSLPRGTLELVDTERSIAPVAPSYRKTDSRILNPSSNRDRGDLPAQNSPSPSIAPIVIFTIIFWALVASWVIHGCSK